jgi:hypothetical protein
MRENFVVGVLLFVVGIFVAPPIGTAVFWMISALCFFRSYRIYKRQFAIATRSSSNIKQASIEESDAVVYSAINPLMSAYDQSGTPQAMIRDSVLKQYGLMDGSHILSQCLRKGMTEDMVRLSFGEPEGRDVEESASGRTEIWKYEQTGKNRFLLRVYLRDGVVVDWKDRRSNF